jgi:hypothetical protein
MFHLLVRVRVRSHKRSEFVLSARTLLGADDGMLGSPIITQGLEDPNLLCCWAAWESEVQVRQFLAGDAYRALRGAARTLAEEWGVEILRDMDPAGGWAELVGAPKSGQAARHGDPSALADGGA